MATVAQALTPARLLSDLATGRPTLYCGLDPTAPSLHFGSCCNC